MGGEAVLLVGEVAEGRDSAGGRPADLHPDATNCYLQTTSLEYTKAFSPSTPFLTFF